MSGNYGKQIRRNSERVLMGAIVLLIAFVVIAYIRGAGNDNKTDNSDSVAAVTDNMATIGKAVTVNGVEYVVDSVSEGAEYNGETTENKFVIVTLSAANNGKQEAEVYSELFYLYDSEEREFKGDVKRDSGSSAGYFGYGDAIAPGLKKSGTVAFEVPTGVSGFKLAIRDGMTSTNPDNFTYINLK